MNCTLHICVWLACIVGHAIAVEAEPPMRNPDTGYNYEPYDEFETEEMLSDQDVRGATTDNAVRNMHGRGRGGLFRRLLGSGYGGYGRYPGGYGSGYGFGRYNPTYGAYRGGGRRRFPGPGAYGMFR